MRPSFKTTTLIAAIGMIAYSLYVIARYILHDFGLIHCYYSLGYDIRVRLIYDILPVSLIIAGIGLFKYLPSNAASTSLSDAIGGIGSAGVHVTSSSHTQSEPFASWASLI